jgi:DNA modification methylase
MNYISEQTNALVLGHVLDALDALQPNSIQCVITSPPYWGMRLYKRGVKAKWPDKSTVPFGAESTPEQYVERVREVLSKLIVPLKDKGCIWLNLGDTYFTRAIMRKSSSEKLDAFEGRRKDSWKDAKYKRYSSGHTYLKDKDLTLIPFLVAHEAQKLGYWVRSIVIWEKENFVPEPQLDRPILSNEYILMLTKSRFYKWNKKAAIENGANDDEEIQRQLRSVWTMRTSNGKNGHPAPFPELLVERCAALSTRKNDLILDPFLGSGTTAVVAERLGRKFIGIDAVKSYLDQSDKRITKQNSNVKIRRYEVRREEKLVVVSK